MSEGDPRDYAKNISVIDGVKFKWRTNFLEAKHIKKWTSFKNVSAAAQISLAY